MITALLISGCGKEKNTDLEISDEFLDENQVFSNNSDFVYDNSKKVIGPDGYRESSKFIEALLIQLKRDPQNPLLFNNIAFEYYKARNFEKALTYYKKALAINPKMGTCYNNMALVYFQQNKMDMAIEMFKKCIEVNPTFVQAYSSLGLIYHRQGETKKAKVNLNKALTLNNEKLLKIEDIITKGGLTATENEEIKKEFDRLQSNEAITHNNLGLVHYEEKKYSTASIHFKKALDLDSDIGVAIYNLGMISMAEKKYPEAVTLFERYLKLNPKQFNALKKLEQARKMITIQNSAIMNSTIKIPEDTNIE